MRGHRSQRSLFQCADFLVILLQGSEILLRLRELAFFHSFANIPMNESTLRLPQGKLVIGA